MKKVLLIAAGFLLLAVGAVGLLLPVWPTTPFVLLSVGCFSTTPAIRQRILRIGFVREHYENYTRRSGLSRKTLVKSLVFLWGMLALSMLVVRTPLICSLLAVIGLAVTVHLVYMAKAKPQKEDSTAKEQS